ncbi:MAG TPA: M1 family metallopeptidase, partial [Chitinophagales bacterium]|nr:M1 family metallopeptidase [Chitinophagales bacterium]
YWKNRPPSSDYWQQDVYYQITAAIDERTDIIEGEEKLTYWNNSPDTLSFVFFHLYQQAFVKGGHLENLNLNNNTRQTFGRYEASGLGEKITSIKSGNTELKTELDFSVMKVYLPENLLPGDSIIFDIRFKTYFDNGSQRRRMKKFNASGFTHYDGVHWYPRICVYDRKLGWDTDQHLGKEFYGNFGTYDVQLNFASNYVVGATGTLQNTGEVLPESLRQKLNIRNFASKQWESKASIITPYDSSQRKTWHFYAENVHDFAWTADPTYRIGEAYATIWDPYLQRSRKVQCQSMAQESHAAGWQDAAAFTARCIEVYSLDFGMYSWPKIIVADARDGMEYPMLTLDGGFTPGYYDVISHEVGHMWFFAQVGNNETYRASLDEGFTQFIESWALRHITGDTVLESPQQNKYYARFHKPTLVMVGEIYLGYLPDAAKGTDESINQHSDAFNGALGHGGGYRHVYYKAATMLLNLQYVLGDSLFQDAMKHYFDQWKFAHPYFEDFRNSIIQYTHTDLNWFFDEWMESTKTIDYAITGVKKERDQSYRISFLRRGRSQMPVDFSVLAKDGKEYNFHIPNTWFVKKTNALVLPKWYGWDRLHPTYSCNITIPSGIENVEIDPSHRLADVYMPNNSKKFAATLNFDSQITNNPDWKQYQFYWRPDIWYNAVDGLKAGLHLDGNYFNLKNKFSLTAWFNSTLLQNGIPKYEIEKAGFDSIIPVSFNFTYGTNTHRFIKNSSVDAGVKFLDGLWGGNANFTIQVNTNNAITLGVKSMYRPSAFDLNYLLYPEQWIAGNLNTTASLGLEHKYQYFNGNGRMNLLLRSATLFSDYQHADL